MKFNRFIQVYLSNMYIIMKFIFLLLIAFSFEINSQEEFKNEENDSPKRTDVFGVHNFTHKYCHLKGHSPDNSILKKKNSFVFGYDFHGKVVSGQRGGLTMLVIYSNKNLLSEEELKKLRPTIIYQNEKCIMAQGYFYGKNFMKDKVDKIKLYKFYRELFNHIEKSEHCK